MLTEEQKKERKLKAREYYRQYWRDPARKRQHKRSNLMRKFGMTPDQWEALFLSQGNGCAICLTTNPGSKSGWHTDHCHTSKKVRGILCHHCNIMLGHAKDNPVTMQYAIDYLRRHHVR